jgi:ATP-dependent Clp protease protease subunit
MRPNRLFQLLAQNRNADSKFTVKAESNADEATIYLYGVIVDDSYWGGISASDVAQALAQITASTIHVRVNSPGGDVFAGRTIQSLLRAHPAKVIAYVDGLAASAMSFAIMGADEIEIADGAMIMIHKGWTIALGNEDDMRATADLLNKVDGTIVKTYADRTGQEVEQLAAWMTAETWMTAEESVERGFADRLAEQAAGAQAKAWNLAAYQNAPKPDHPTAQTPNPPAQAAPPAGADDRADSTDSPKPDRAALRRVAQARLIAIPA